MFDRLIQLFPVWALLFSTAAMAWPAVFITLQHTIIPMLGVVMFGMGIGLRLEDFKLCLKQPLVITTGAAAQFLIMPAAAWLIANLFQLPTELKIGLVILGCCPGGTASNVVCFLSKGDVALSITLTTLSTLLALITTPILTWLYLGETIDIPVTKMCLDILKIVLLPVSLGVALNHMMGQKFQNIKTFFPLLSVIAIVLIISIIVALNRNKLADVGLSIMLCILLHNAIGLGSGYIIPRLFGYNPKIARTIALEVGMQNSGLAVALALKYFTPLAALPAALFSIWHNLSGSVLASYWSGKHHSDDASS